jgi:hypothetical protein
LELSKKNYMKKLLVISSTLLFLFSLQVVASVQDAAVVLSSAELTRVVPPGFYFQGQSAPTQMRNAAAARFGANRYLIAGLVDTSGYAADVRAKYQGFLITDSPVAVNGTELASGAYGFGFGSDAKMNVLDLAGNQVLSVSTTKDSELKRPRPLMMTRSAEGIRLYGGKDYVTVSFK